MLNRPNEYKKMAEVERNFWWYHALHERCESVIQYIFSSLEVKILDAGCGTGGLLRYLIDKGYRNVQGFDLSEFATSHCLDHQLDVCKLDLREIKTRFDSELFDVIVSNDTLYFLTETERQSFLIDCYEILRPGGLLILNLPALNAFSGVHDLAVGIKHRFSSIDIQRMNRAGKFYIVQKTYWPFLISPLVYTIRMLQRARLKRGMIRVIRSDLKVPANWINTMLIKICQYEAKFLERKAPFGSSIFIVLRRKE